MPKVVFLGFLILILIVISIFQILPNKELVSLAEPAKKSFFPTLKNEDFKIQLVQTGLNFPTKMTFVDEETILVAQKADGKVMVIKNFELQTEPALDLNVESGWERGFSGIISIKSQNQTFVFVYFTESVTDGDTHDPGGKKQGNENNGNKLVRYEWDGKSLINPILILHPIPYSNSNHHGGVMTNVGEQLFLIVGDNNEKNNFLINEPEEKFYDRGVIFRINLDGEAISSNPFDDVKLSKYYSYGIRNGYGLAVDPITNQVWDTENGDRDFDEVNLIFPGFNSGWDKITGPNGIGEYSSELSNLTSIEGSRYSDPEFSFHYSIGLTGMEFLKSQTYGIDYQNDLFIGDVYGTLYHFELNENRDGFVFSDPVLSDLVSNSKDEKESIIFGENLGIITDIKTGPDGYLYITSMVQSDVPGWLLWAGNLKNPIEEQGTMLGTIFRLVPSSIFNEFEKIPSPREQVENGCVGCMFLSNSVQNITVNELVPKFRRGLSATVTNSVVESSMSMPLPIAPVTNEPGEPFQAASRPLGPESVRSPSNL